MIVTLVVDLYLVREGPMYRGGNKAANLPDFHMLSFALSGNSVHTYIVTETQCFLQTQSCLLLMQNSH